MTNVQLIIIWAIDIAVNNVSVFDVLGINVWEINVRLWFYCHPPILEYLTVHCLLVFHVAVLIHPSISNSSSVQKHSACPNPPFKVTLPHLTNQYHTIALCQSCENLYFKVPNFDKLFLCGFSSRMSKILRRVVQTPQESRKSKKDKHEEEKEGENAKNMKGVFAKVKTGLKKSVLINATIFALCTFLANTP